MFSPLLLIYLRNYISRRLNITFYLRTLLLIKSIILELADFCIESNYFVFKNNFFLQINGTAVGNLMSPILANMVINILLDTVIP